MPNQPLFFSRTSRVAALVICLAMPMAAAAIDVTDPLADPSIRAEIQARRNALEQRGAAPSIALDLRVTTNTTGSGCASAGDGPINVIEGTSIQYCYFVDNTGDTALRFHDIVSSEFGAVRLGLDQNLAPGAGTLLRRVVAAEADQINLATWYAHETISGYEQIEGTCSFPELEGSGIAFNLADDGSIVVPLPAPFPIWGAATQDLYICNNGYVSWASNSNQCIFGNEALPRPLPALTIAPYWDDLDSETGTLYRGEFVYTSAPRALRGSTGYEVIQWDNRAHFPGPGVSPATFAIGLIQPDLGLDGYVFMCHQDTNFGNATFNFGASATVGINGDATNASQFSFNTANATLLGGPSTGLGYMPLDTGLGANSTDTVIVTTTPDLIFRNGFESPSSAPDHMKDDV